MRVLIGATMLVVGMLHAQSAVARPAEQAEIARVTPRQPGSQFVWRNSGELFAFGVTLADMLREVYSESVLEFAVFPEWFRKDQWQITISLNKALPGAQRADFNETLLKLIQERFGLRFSEVGREVPILKLMASRPPDGRHFRKSRSGTPTRWLVSDGRFVASGVDMEALCGRLSFLIGEEVVDATGFAGEFDLEFYIGRKEEMLDPIKAVRDALEIYLGLEIQVSTAHRTVLIVEEVRKTR